MMGSTQTLPLKSINHHKHMCIIGISIKTSMCHKRSVDKVLWEFKRLLLPVGGNRKVIFKKNFPHFIQTPEKLYLNIG